jgi:hypothetical protein
MQCISMFHKIDEVACNASSRAEHAKNEVLDRKEGGDTASEDRLLAKSDDRFESFKRLLRKDVLAIIPVYYINILKH